MAGTTRWLFCFVLAFATAAAFTSLAAAQFPGGPSSPSPGGGGFGGGGGAYRPPSPGGGGYNPNTGIRQPGSGYSRPGSSYSPASTGYQPRTPGYTREPTHYGSQFDEPSIRQQRESNRFLPGGGWSQPQARDPIEHIRQQHQQDMQRMDQLRNPFYRGRFAEKAESITPRIYGGGFSQRSGQWSQAHDALRQGQQSRAMEIIEQQLERSRNLSGLMSAVDTLESAQADRSTFEKYRSEALQMAREQIERGRAKDPLAYVAVAKFSLEDQNDAEFRSAATSLAKQFPNDKHSHFYQGIAAAKDGNWKTAEASLRKAKEMGVPDESVALWLKMAIDNQRWVWQYAWITLWVLVAWVVGLVLLYVVGKIFSSLTLRSVKRGAARGKVEGSRFLRTLYRALIAVAGVYYYISLPLLLIASIALPLTICYALLNVPVISFWLIGVVAVISIGSILTALSGFAACFVRLDPQLPGKKLEPHEHPRLWELTREVAQRVGTRPIDAIYLLPTSDAAVVERGSFWQRFRDRGERVLILGVGLLEGFSQRGLSSVLAHEYGHFQNRDTAGGGLALRVNRAMENFAEAISRRGKIRWWHLAVQFLKFYYVLFNRITFGASRLQEVLADRIAVVAYGPAAMQEGLTHAIRRSIEFDYWANRRLSEAIRGERAALAFVQLAERPDVSAFENIETALKRVIDRPTNETDTHPSPRDRFAFARQVGAADAPADGSMVWDLFDRPRDLMRELHQEFQQLLDSEAELVRAIIDAKIAYLTDVIRQQPSAEAHYARAGVHLEKGDHRAALSDLDVALRRDPHSLDVRAGKVFALQAAKRFAEAAEDMRQLLDKFPQARCADSYFLLGECYRDAGDLPRSEGAFLQATAERGDVLGAKLALGQVRVKLEKVGDAVDDFSYVIERLPDSAEAYVDRADAYRAQGLHGSALADLQKAVSLAVVYPRAHRAYAALLLEQGGESNAALALRHAKIACAATVGLEESIPVLAAAYTACGDPALAAAALSELAVTASLLEPPAGAGRTDIFAQAGLRA